MSQPKASAGSRRQDWQDVAITDAPVPAKVAQEPVVGEMPNAEGAQQDSGAVGQPVEGVVGASQDGRNEAPVPAWVAQEPEVGDMPNAKGAQKDGLAVGQEMTWAQVVQGLKYKD